MTGGYQCCEEDHINLVNYFHFSSCEFIILVWCGEVWKSSEVFVHWARNADTFILLRLCTIYTYTHFLSLSLSLSLSHTCTYVPRAVAFNNARDDSDLSGGHPQTRADRPDGGVGRGHVGEGAEVQIDHCTELSK